MLVYYIFRRVGAARQERGRRMNFDGFLGNGALKARLQESFRQGKTSHCYLLCGVEGSGRRTLALRMAAALECRDETNPGCGVCPACRKVLSGQHPDVITVDDTEHKNVAVDIIRQARSDVFIRPNELTKQQCPDTRSGQATTEPRWRIWSGVSVLFAYRERLSSIQLSYSSLTRTTTAPSHSPSVCHNHLPQPHSASDIINQQKLYLSISISVPPIP